MCFFDCVFGVFYITYVFVHVHADVHADVHATPCHSCVRQSTAVGRYDGGSDTTGTCIITWREDAVDAGVAKVAVDAGVDARCSQIGLEEAAVRFVRARATRAGEDTPGRRTRTRTG